MADEEMFVAAREGPNLAQIASRVLNRPLLLHPTKAELLLHVLQGRISIDGATAGPLPPDASRFLGTRTRADGSWRMNPAQNGVAVISIVGSLVNRGAWIGASSGLVSYEGIAAQLRDAAADPEVRSIMLDIDSPGGEATGMFALAEQIREVAKTKKVVAFVNDMAASAAYGLASAATEIVVSPTSIVGSIGVVLTHIDRSGEMEQRGIKATLIHAGKHKVDGNPFGPLSETVQADLQTEVMKFYDQFVGLVARGRPGMTDAAIRGTEARTFLGQEAIDRGLADRIASLDATLLSLQSPSAANGQSRKGFAMSDPTITPEAHAAAVATARAEGVAEGRTAGAADATTRIGAILSADAAQGREALAAHFAFKTDIPADAAIAALAAAPTGAAAATTTTTTTIEQRAAGAAEMGGDGGNIPNPNAAADAAWAKAVAQINR